MIEATGLGPTPQWRPRDGLVALALALVTTLVLGTLLAGIMLLSGIKHLDSSPAFTFAATLAQELAFITAALVVARQVGPLRLRQFGVRSFKPSAWGWTLLAMVAYLILAAVYVQLFHPPEDNLPRSFGADRSVGLAIATGILVIAVAPVVEEFFFRGFLYKSLRNGTGAWSAALVSGAIFGAIHFKPEFIFPLAILGAILALLYERTGSLWPCIALHAANNALAFVVLVT